VNLGSERGKEKERRERESTHHPPNKLAFTASPKFRTVCNANQTKPSSNAQ